jgi:hypothetical protein
MDKMSEIERLLKTASRKTEEAANQYKSGEEDSAMAAAQSSDSEMMVAAAAGTAATTKTRVAKPALSTAVDMDVEESDDLASAVRKKKSAKKKGAKK